MQGRATETSVLAALEGLRRRASELDVVLVCRGGGSRTDLAWLDSEALGRAVACFPLPVLVGIGHEQDHSVLDAVGRRCKTPTAAAALLVETVAGGLARLEAATRSVLDAARRRLAEEARRDAERGRRLGLASRGLLGRERVVLVHRADLVLRGSRTLLSAARERLRRPALGVPRAATIELARRLDGLLALRRVLAQGARRDLTRARDRVAELATALGPGTRRLVAREAERTDGRGRRLHVVDPRRVVERGYAILRRQGGRVLSDAGEAPVGSSIEAELRRGVLRLRSLGPREDATEALETDHDRP
jgi:exodeoxyribonuclease VII large subunit